MRIGSASGIAGRGDSSLIRPVCVMTGSDRIGPNYRIGPIFYIFSSFFLSFFFPFSLFFSFRFFFHQLKNKLAIVDR